MALEEESIVQTWLNGLKTLDVKTKHIQQYLIIIKKEPLEMV